MLVLLKSILKGAQPEVTDGVNENCENEKVEQTSPTSRAKELSSFILWVIISRKVRDK